MDAKVLPLVFYLLLSGDIDPMVVNSLEDMASPPAGTVTLRMALEHAANNQAIFFDKALDGGTIELTRVAEAHTILKGEVMGMRPGDPGAPPVSYLVGYFDRDYGRSALYARKNVVLDASALPHGITIKWNGEEDQSARVLAVYGDVRLKNVKITGGRSVAEEISSSNPEQPWTLARGGGLAVWGRLMLEDSEVYDNHCVSDDDLPSRDRGAFGGGIYADIVEIKNSIVSGNSVKGMGAAGGGVYSVGGADSRHTVSKIEQSNISGNRISGIFTYGGGVYSDGGGIGNLKNLEITNSTIAGNRVEPLPVMPPFLLQQMGYWRGEGTYMSNGNLTIQGSTIAQNEVHGYLREDNLGKSNLAGGVAATVGDAHAVEVMTIGQSIIAGNTITELSITDDTPVIRPHDIYSGSLLHFVSKGYNRIGTIDFSQILVPVGQFLWGSLSRKHYPQVGDADGVLLESVVDLEGGVTFSDHIPFPEADDEQQVMLYYNPRGSSLDRIPTSYSTVNTYFDYARYNGYDDGDKETFLEIILGRIEWEYNLVGFADGFRQKFETYLQTVDADESDNQDPDPGPEPDPYPDLYGEPVYTLRDTEWWGPAGTWPSKIYNYPYMQFWHRLDAELAQEEIRALTDMGPELLGDNVWQTLFSAGFLDENDRIRIREGKEVTTAVPLPVDQLDRARPADVLADIGAVELKD